MYEEDWKIGKNTKIFGDTDLKVPSGCCKKVMLGKEKKELKDAEITDCQKTPEGITDKFDMLEGCYTKLKDSVRDHKSKILGVAITILVVMVSFVLRPLKKSKKKLNKYKELILY